MFLFVNYCFKMFWPQFLVIFRELVNFSKSAAYVSTYLAEVLHVWLKL